METIRVVANVDLPELRRLDVGELPDTPRVRKMIEKRLIDEVYPTPECPVCGLPEVEEHTDCEDAQQVEEYAASGTLWADAVEKLSLATVEKLRELAELSGIELPARAVKAEIVAVLAEAGVDVERVESVGDEPKPLVEVLAPETSYEGGEEL